MNIEEVPLLEFDDDPDALIQPHFFARAKPILPERCVMPICGSIIDSLKRGGRLEKIHEIPTAAGPLFSIEVFKAEFEGGHVALVFPGVGAPFVAAVLEELIALGCHKFVACGVGGVLKSELKRGTIVIPSAAVRDEGTSYHYLPSHRAVTVDREVVRKLEAVLARHGVECEVGKTWTTDAFFRETKGKISRRKEEACLMVEMECAALLAVVQFRGVVFRQYLATGDDVSGLEWDPRYVADSTSFQEKVFRLSVEACLSL